MKELLLIRHGEAAHLVGGLTGGWTASDLTALGYKQAHRTGLVLAGMLADRTVELFGSDQPRAEQTAVEIGQALQMQPQLTPALRELNNGIAAGLTLPEASAIALPPTQPAIDWIAYPQAESWRMMAERVHRFLDEIHRRDIQTAIVVSHGHASVAAVFWWLRMGEEFWDKVAFHFCPASITFLGIDASDARTIYKLNDTSHLHDLPTAFDRPNFR